MKDWLQNTLFRFKKQKNTNSLNLAILLKVLKVSVCVSGCAIVLVRNNKRYLTACMNKTVVHRNITQTHPHMRTHTHTHTHTNAHTRSQTPTHPHTRLLKRTIPVNTYDHTKLKELLFKKSISSAYRRCCPYKLLR